MKCLTNQAGLLLLLGLFLLPGCKSIVTDEYIGQPIAADEAEELEGVWKFDDTVLQVKHMRGADFLAVALDWHEDAYKVNEFKMLITDHADVMMLFAVNVDDEGDEEDGWLICGLLTKSGDDAVVMFAPNFQRFKQALDNGEIRGGLDEDGNTLRIKSTKTSLEALITRDNLHEFFTMHRPLAIPRVGDL